MASPDFQNKPLRSGALVEHLADTLSRNANAQTIFGIPVERGTITVIPVGRIGYGFGGGTGNTDQRESGQAESRSDGSRNEFGRDGGGGSAGTGGGGGMGATPIGYIEIRNGKSRFRRIHTPGSIAQLILATGLSAWFVLKGLKALNEARSSGRELVF